MSRFILLIFCTFVFSGSIVESAPKKNIKRTMVMMTTAEHSPFEFFQGEGKTRKIVGFDIDLAQEIAKKLGVSLRVEHHDFDLIPHLLAKNRVDFAMSAINPTPARTTNVLFSTPYYESLAALVVKKDSPIRVVGDLREKKIGIKRGSPYDQFIRKLTNKTPDVTIIGFDKTAELFKAINEDMIHGTVVMELTAKSVIKDNPDLTYYALDEKLPIAVAFPKNYKTRKKQFDKIIEQLQKDGTIDRLAEKWFGVKKELDK
jgi:arginine/lysine/histidine transport system permease protein/arginine/lysine/histidine transporter system substrate-binding protein